MQTFAEKSGLSKGYISMLEAGKHPRSGDAIDPSLNTLNGCAAAMGIDCDALVSMINQKTDPLAESRFQTGQRIRKERVLLGLRQTDLASLAGISKQTLYKYENGVVTNIPSDVIEKLAEALGTTPAYLMGWAEETVGKNVCRERKKRGWTQEHLAMLMGYKSKSTINKIELGIHDVSQSKLVKFAQVFETTPAYLAGWDTQGAANNGDGHWDAADVAFYQDYKALDEDGKTILRDLARIMRKRGNI